MKMAIGFIAVIMCGCMFFHEKQETRLKYHNRNSAVIKISKPKKITVVKEENINSQQIEEIRADVNDEIKMTNDDIESTINDQRKILLK